MTSTAEVKKNMYYVQVWPYGVGCGNYNAYAFGDEAEAQKMIGKKENAVWSDYKEMQAGFGNNFCILSDGSVCSRKEAVELSQLYGESYK